MLYKKTGKSQVSWINSIVSDQFAASCTLCNKTFKIDNGGIPQYNARGKTKRQSEIEKQRKSQIKFYLFKSCTNIIKKSKYFDIR